MGPGGCEEVKLMMVRSLLTLIDIGESLLDGHVLGEAIGSMSVFGASEAVIIVSYAESKDGVPVLLTWRRC